MKAEKTVEIAIELIPWKRLAVKVEAANGRFP